MKPTSSGISTSGVDIVGGGVAERVDIVSGGVVKVVDVDGDVVNGVDVAVVFLGGGSGRGDLTLQASGGGIGGESGITPCDGSTPIFIDLSPYEG